MKILKHVILTLSAASLTGYTLLQNEPAVTVSLFTPQLHYDTCSTQLISAGSTAGLTQITLAGEEVPLQSRKVRSRVSREINDRLANPKALRHLMQHSKLMYSRVQPILKKHGIPRDFRYVMVIESMGVGTAVSHRGATGLWQLMADPARDLGLRVNDTVDERMHLEKATNAACRYIKSLYKETGSWTNALVAYNLGVSRFMRKCGQAGHDNYYKLRLNQETNRYIYKIIALKELTERPEAYGLLPAKAPMPVLLAANRRLKAKKLQPVLSYRAPNHHSPVAQMQARNPWLASRAIAPAWPNIAQGTAPLPKALRIAGQPATTASPQVLLAMGLPRRIRQ